METQSGDGEFLHDYRIKDDTDLMSTADRLSNEGETRKLTEYEKALIQLNEAVLASPRGTIDLANKGLNILPREIAIFRNLTELNLAGNYLSEFPLFLCHLKNLRRLYLQDNALLRIPGEVKMLRSLEVLSLRDNQLAALPIEIGALTNLKEVDISGNNIKALPSSMAKLSALEVLLIHGNEIPVPPEILGRSPADVIAFVLQVTAKDSRSISEAKVLLVGQGGVGKTSLIKRMMEDIFDEYEPKTEGILIKNWHVNVYGRWIRMNVWDFGGQEIMHATHQFFLTERSLYVLVWDSRQEDNYGQLEYWLNIIQSFGKTAPVIVVLNKTDIGLAEIDRRGLQRKFPNIKAFVNCSCKSGSGMAELREYIQWHAYHLPHTTTTWPLKWFEVKSNLERINKDYISIREYDRYCSAVHIYEESDRRNLLQFLHDLGIVLSFHDDARLCDTNVLNPEWATSGVYKILNDKDLFGKGILDIRDLPRILNDSRYPRNKHGFIINIMQKFELGYQIDDKDKTRFLIPDLLTKQQPFFKWDYRHSLAFQYHYNFLPGSVISRFIVRMHSFIDKELVWHNGVILRDGKNRALVLSDKTARKIYIYVEGPQATRRDLLAEIRINFEHIHRTISAIRAAAKVPYAEDHDIIVDYQHLIDLESLGEETFVPEGLRKKVRIRDFLFGIKRNLESVERFIEVERTNVDAPKINVTVLNNLTDIGRQTMAIDRSQKIDAGRDISINQSQVMLDDIKGDVSNKIANLSGADAEIKKLLTELYRFIEQDPVLPDTEKEVALTKTGILAQLASKAVQASEGFVEDTIRSIRGTIVDGSAELFNSGKDLLHQIKDHFLNQLGK